jgi:hypothetical protein
MCDQCCHDPSINHTVSWILIYIKFLIVEFNPERNSFIPQSIVLHIHVGYKCRCSLPLFIILVAIAQRKWDNSSWMLQLHEFLKILRTREKSMVFKLQLGLKHLLKHELAMLLKRRMWDFFWCTWIERSAALPLNRTGIAAACSSSSFGFSIAEKKKTVDLQARPNPKAPSCNWVSLNYFLESKARSTASCSRSTCSSAWSHHEFSRAALQQTKGFLCLVSGAKKRTSLENRIYVLHIVCTRNVSWWVAAKSHNGFCLAGQTMNRNYRETSQLQL